MLLWNNGSMTLFKLFGDRIDEPSEFGRALARYLEEMQAGPQAKGLTKADISQLKRLTVYRSH